MDKCRVVIYDCFVPLNEQTKVKHFEKIESMEKEIQNYPEYEIIGKFFDECSATTPMNDRPEFQKVMEKVNTLAVDMIATVSMKYFSRSVEDTMAAVKTFQEKGVSLNCNAEHFDSFHIEIVENLEFIKQLDLGFDDMDDIEEPDSGMIMQ